MPEKKDLRKVVLQIIPFALFGIVCISFMFYSDFSDSTSIDGEKSTPQVEAVKMTAEVALQQLEETKRLVKEKEAIIAKLEAELAACKDN